jgi:hypothetical protein
MYNILKISKKKKKKIKGIHIDKKNNIPRWVNNNLRIDSNNVFNPMLKTSLSRQSAITNSRLGKLVIRNPFVNANNIKGIKKKDLTWTQAMKKDPRLSPFGDADKDGVINMLDCRPFDKTRQDKGKRGRKGGGMTATQYKIARLKSLSRSMGSAYDTGRRVIKSKTDYDVKEDDRIKGLTESEWKNEQIKKKNAPAYQKKFEALEKKRYEQAINDQDRVEKQEYKEKIKKKNKEIYDNSSLGRAQKRAKFETGVVGLVASARYGREKQETSNKVRKATLGIINAFNDPTAGGFIKENTSVGSYGGQRGRPRGSYDPRYAAYGGVEGYRRFIVEQNRKRAMVIAQMEAQRMRAQMTQSQQEQARYMQANPQEAQSQSDYSQQEDVQMPQMQYVPQQPMQPMTAQDMKAANNLNRVYQRQQIMGNQTPTIVQPQKGNPWGLLAKWRPNFKLNIFKKQTNALASAGPGTRLMTAGPNLIKTEPVLRRVPINQQGRGVYSNNSTNPNYMTTQQVPQEYIDQQTMPTGSYQNQREEGDVLTNDYY